MVSEFLYIPWKYSLEQSAASARERREEDIVSSTPITLISAEVLESAVAEYLKEQVFIIYCASCFFCNNRINQSFSSILHLPSFSLIFGGADKQVLHGEASEDCK